MHIFAYILTVISLLLGAAHFMRDGNNGLMLFLMLLPLLFTIRKRYILHILAGALIILAVGWVQTALKIYETRVLMGMPAMRMLIIMFAVYIFTLISVFTLYSKKMKLLYPRQSSDIVATTAFFLTFFLIGFPFLKVDFPVILLERFLPGFGWLQIGLMSLYAAFVAEKLFQKHLIKKWRRIIWTIFSVVFFLQLLLGLTGIEKMLMTGELHLPVPAIILAGPIYRLELSFMVFLFLGSMLLLGPAWCSYLCYFGIWDNYAADSKKRQSQKSPNALLIRIIFLLLVIAVAVILNIAGISGLVATLLGAFFGIAGIFIMIFISRKKGVMVHCTTYCPVGTLAVLAGKISPFRIAISSSCNACMRCTTVCRYNALGKAEVLNRKPNINCTLCGDCVNECEDKISAVNYRFLKLKPETARMIFVILAASLHTVFMAIGRV